ncbi:MAG: diguanylate cyclase [Lachnospiraceae bacterium]|nr:diguanylate cyclase [Lachnospiraceae bacterium]
MKKILIVDDEDVMLELARLVLEEDYETVCASSGEEAVRLFETERPDMILSDLLMPKMSGYELQQIIQEKSNKQIPFIFMTADERDESENLGFELGAADYIRKPLKSDLLLRRIERVFHNVEQVAGWKKAASTDMMTGLLNKSASQREISTACMESQGTLMMIDLDSFKLVNDIYGHEMGDRILIRFSNLIKSITREDDLAGRMGGDEFIAFFRHLNDEQIIAKKTAFLNEELVKSAKEYMGEDMEIPLGASIGAVFVPDAGTDFEALFKKADSALYTVKQKGKHGYALYQGESLQKEETAIGNMDNLRMIFGERNIGHGALIVEKGNFQMIYQFLMRFISNYTWDIHLAVFSIENENMENISQVTDQF